MGKANYKILEEKLSSFNRFRLLDEPTRIHPLKNLNKQLNGIEVYVKRDDVMSMGLGGNKLRKLEFILGDAIAEGADVLITSGGIQSNHARLTAVAAAYAGLDCEIVLTQAVPKNDPVYTGNGNILLEKILDVKMHLLPADENANVFTDRRVSELKAAGKKPYVIPMGGSSPIGCLGYVSCFQEILIQSEELNLHFDTIIVPNGSGGTHTGLLTGVKIADVRKTNIKSYTVLATLEKAISVTQEKTGATLDIIDKDVPVDRDDIDIDDSCLGTGYGIPTEEMVNAVKLLARTEGIFLDPVYSGKAFAGMLNDIQKGKFKAGSRLLFILTGGLPGLFAYEPAFAEK